MEIPEIKLKWYDYLSIWCSKITLRFSYFKNFLRNCWNFRKELAHYQGWDYSFDIEMLLKMYEIKVKSFEIGKNMLLLIKNLKK